MILMPLLCTVMPVQGEDPVARKAVEDFRLSVTLDDARTLRGYETSWKGRVIESGEGPFVRGVPLFAGQSAPFLVRGCQDSREDALAGRRECSKADSLLFWIETARGAPAGTLLVIASATGPRVHEVFPFLRQESFAWASGADNYAIGLHCATGRREGVRATARARSAH